MLLAGRLAVGLRAGLIAAGGIVLLRAVVRLAGGAVLLRAREAPTLTVVFDGDERKFAPGHDIHIGRDIHADVRITHPLVSRIHLIIRFVDGKWIAEDQRSLNGIFVNGRQVGWVEVRDDTVINLGDSVNWRP